MSSNPDSKTGRDQDRLLSNIFIIDDEPVAGKVIALYLSQAGYQNLHVFTSSVEAMEILSIVNADLILTDVNMPELGGKFLTRLVRNYPHLQSTPVVVVTSDETDSTRTQLLGNGVFRILNKPTNQVELLDAVHEALRTRNRTLNPTAGNHFPDNESSRSKRLEKEQILRSAFKRG